MISNKFKIWDNYEKNDLDFSICRNKFTKEFYELYNQAFQYYLHGDWENAKKNFDLAEMVLGERDGPSQCILNYMREHNFTMPSNWKGGRIAEF